MNKYAAVASNLNRRNPLIFMYYRNKSTQYQACMARRGQRKEIVHYAAAVVPGERFSE